MTTPLDQIEDAINTALSYSMRPEHDVELNAALAHIQKLRETATETKKKHVAGWNTAGLGGETKEVGITVFEAAKILGDFVNGGGDE